MGFKKRFWSIHYSAKLFRKIKRPSKKYVWGAGARIRNLIETFARTDYANRFWQVVVFVSQYKRWWRSQILSRAAGDVDHLKSEWVSHWKNSTHFQWLHRFTIFRVVVPERCPQNIFLFAAFEITLLGLHL